MIGTRTSAKADYIFSQDPALDPNSPNFKEEWEKSMLTGDVSGIPIKPGQKPTVFSLRKLTRKQFQYIIETSDSRKFSEALAFGLAAVKDFEVDGRPLVLTFEQTPNGPRLDERTLDEMFSPSVIPEIGARVISLSTLTNYPTSGQS